MGSSRAAFHAGTKLAIDAISSSTADTRTKTQGSVGLISKSIPVRKRVRSADEPRPITRPAADNVNPRERISPRTLERGAPSADYFRPTTRTLRRGGSAQTLQFCAPPAERRALIACMSVPL